MNIGKIAVLGGGNSGQCMAGVLALRGYNVYLWDRTPDNLAAVFRNKRIRLFGCIEGEAKLGDVCEDIGEAVKGAEIIYIPLPAYAHRFTSERCAPYLKDGQIVVFCSNSGLGSFILAQTLRELGIKKDILCAEHSYPYGTRVVGPGVVYVRADFADRRVSPRGVGVFPAKRTQEVMPFVEELYPGWYAAENSLASALLQNGPCIHPAIMILGVSLIENLELIETHGWGTTPSARKVIYQLNQERMAIEAAWSYKVTDVFPPEYFAGESTIMRETLGSSDVKKGEEKHIKERLWMEHRYVTEDIAYGLVLRSSCAKKTGVQVPTSDAMIHLASVINGDDYYGTGRSLENLGLGAMTKDQINDLLYEGWA